MKRMTLLTLFVVCQIWAQNNVPVISNFTTNLDSTNHIVIFEYDLWDDENDSMLVSLKISDNNGETYLYDAENLSGDIGFPVLSGHGKQIVWPHTPNSNTTFTAKLVADDLYEISISEIVGGVDSLNLIHHVSQLEGVRHRTTGFDHLQFSKQYIEDHFTNNGIQASRGEFTKWGYNAANIIGKHAGHHDESLVYIIEGHFDTVLGSPGADDNGSGVSGMLEAMRVLSQYEFGRTIKFLGLDLEEEGLFGAINYVDESIPQYEQTEGVINLDMIGYVNNEPNSQTFPFGFDQLFPDLVSFAESDSSRGNFIFNFANENSSQLMEYFNTSAAQHAPELRVGSASVPGNSEIAPDLRRGDHAPFWDAGIKALFITVGGEFRSPHYHQTSDTLGTLNFEFITNIVKTTVATIANLAQPIHCGIAFSDTFSVMGSSVSVTDAVGPESFALHQNYPNPFNPSTTISYELPVDSEVSLVVYDILGHEVATLISKNQEAGYRSVNWRGLDNFGQRVSAGMYLYVIRAGDFSEPRKMLLLK